MSAVAAWILGLIFGALAGVVVQSRRIVPANIDIEAPMPSETIAEARQALEQFRDQYPPGELKELGWDLINIAADTNRADIQLKQAEAAPGNAKEVAQGLASVHRLRAKTDMFNRRVAQLRTGSWPE
jgi:hypothetical protein